MNCHCCTRGWRCALADENFAMCRWQSRRRSWGHRVARGEFHHHALQRGDRFTLHGQSAGAFQDPAHPAPRSGCSAAHNPPASRQKQPRHTCPFACGPKGIALTTQGRCGIHYDVVPAPALCERKKWSGYSPLTRSGPRIQNSPAARSFCSRSHRRSPVVSFLPMLRRRGMVKDDSPVIKHGGLKI